MEGAFERYRNNRVIAPRGIGTSSTYQDAGGGGGGGGQNTSAPVGPAVSAAPVK
jgi:hypothetical protein